MSKPMRILVFALGLLIAFRLNAMQPTFNFSDKTVAQLLELLESKDSRVRHCAAIFLADRYGNPNAIVINGPIRKPNSPPPEFPIPAQVIPRLAQHLESDPDMLVRMCAVSALHALRFRTNTTPILVTGLEDKDVLIRIRTCSALIDISQDYSEGLADRVIPTLIQCLAPDGEVENIWQAGYAAEQLGKAGKPLIPALQRLKEHPSPKVQLYAERALSRIGRPAKKKQQPLKTVLDQPSSATNLHGPGAGKSPPSASMMQAPPDLDRTSIDLLKVNIPSLLANKEDYKGKRVEVSGYYVSWFEGSVLKDAKDDSSELSLWIDRFHLKPGHSDTIKWVENGWVRVTGTFTYGQYRSGHLGMCPAEITEVESFDAIR